MQPLQRRPARGLSKAWRVGHKTGSNGKHTTNDIAVLWPLCGGVPWMLTGHLRDSTLDNAGRNQVLAQAARIAEGRIRRLMENCRPAAECAVLWFHSHLAMGTAADALRCRTPPIARSRFRMKAPDPDVPATA